ncbi:type II toxin-antitoxin system MqsA family antitoxin [Anaerotalea alkaliphila]|uniref:Type II toxin-antitoxin system MqsA family antitoxin n=1 Tax=Anaerotalea alkaliphila TaxID=2662126 RepID=A0A7X5KMB6_9FIRM|nr:type II toxin-antitoxin system MqsA family antitoxin [Anaerotalea alkaliphila]NDL67786.1 type II toxin-antitoxin system MqsA family antitoxin [Anaerotalea alkaliphila]
MKKYCANCNNEVETKIKNVVEEYEVKGQKVTVEAEVCYCSGCGEEFFDMELDSNNLLKAYDKYKQSNGLLATTEIKRIRKKYDLSQSAFAKILGLGEKTITRYENGSIQDAAQNNLIMLMDDPSNFKMLWEKNSQMLSPTEIGKVERKLEELFMDPYGVQLLATDYCYISYCYPNLEMDRDFGIQNSGSGFAS